MSDQHTGQLATGAKLVHRCYGSGRTYATVQCDDCGEGGIVLNSGHHYDTSIGMAAENIRNAQRAADEHNAEHHPRARQATTQLTPGQYYDLGHQAAAVLNGHITVAQAMALADDCRREGKPELAPWWGGLADELANIDWHAAQRAETGR